MSDFKALMERRRRLADGTKDLTSEKNVKEIPPNNESFALNGSASNLSCETFQDFFHPPSPSKESQADFKAIMERRRKLADGTMKSKIVSNKETSSYNDSLVLTGSVSNFNYETNQDDEHQSNTPKESLSDFKALMERRRKLADGAIETTDTSEKNSQKSIPSSDGLVFSGSALKLSHEPQQERASQNDYSNGNDHIESPKMKDNLAAIMERRRRISDLGLTINTSDSPVIHIQSPTSNKSSSKSYVAPELFNIMARRKKLADNDDETICSPSEEINNSKKFDDTSRRSSEIWNKTDSRYNDKISNQPISPIQSPKKATSKVSLAPELVHIMARRKKLSDNANADEDNDGESDQNGSSSDSKINLAPDTSGRRSSELCKKSDTINKNVFARSNSERSGLIETESNNISDEKLAEPQPIAQHDNGQRGELIFETRVIVTPGDSEYPQNDNDFSNSEETTGAQTGATELIDGEYELEIQNLIESTTSHEPHSLSCSMSPPPEADQHPNLLTAENDAATHHLVDVVEEKSGALKYDETMSNEIELKDKELSFQEIVEVSSSESLLQSASQVPDPSLTDNIVEEESGALKYDETVSNEIELKNEELSFQEIVEVSSSESLLQSASQVPDPSLADNHSVSPSLIFDESENDQNLLLSIEENVGTTLPCESPTATNDNDALFVETNDHTSLGMHDRSYEKTVEHETEPPDHSDGDSIREIGSQEAMGVVQTHPSDDESASEASGIIAYKNSEPISQDQILTSGSQVSDTLVVESVRATTSLAETNAQTTEKTSSLLGSEILATDELCTTDSRDEASKKVTIAIHENQLADELCVDVEESQRNASEIVSAVTGSFVTETDLAQHETDIREHKSKRKERKTDSNRPRSPNRSRSPKTKVKSRRSSNETALEETFGEPMKETPSTSDLQNSQIGNELLETMAGSKADLHRIASEEHDSPSPNGTIRPTASKKSSKSTDKRQQKSSEGYDSTQVNDIPTSTSELSDRKGESDDSTPDISVAKSFDVLVSDGDERLQQCIPIENVLSNNSMEAVSKLSEKNDIIKASVSELLDNLLKNTDEQSHIDQLPKENNIFEIIQYETTVKIGVTVPEIEPTTDEIPEKDYSVKNHHPDFKNQIKAVDHESQSSHIDPDLSSLKVRVGKGQRRGSQSSKESQDSIISHDSMNSTNLIVGSNDLEFSQEYNRTGGSKTKSSEILQEKRRRRKSSKNTTADNNVSSAVTTSHSASATKENEDKHGKATQLEPDTIIKKKNSRSRRSSKTSSAADSPSEGLRKTRSDLGFQSENTYEDCNIVTSRSEDIARDILFMPNTASNESHDQSLFPTKSSRDAFFLESTAGAENTEEKLSSGEQDCALFVPDVQQSFSGSVRFDDSTSISKQGASTADTSQNSGKKVTLFDKPAFGLKSATSGDNYDNIFDVDLEGFASMPEDSMFSASAPEGVCSPSDESNQFLTSVTEQTNVYPNFDVDNFGTFTHPFEPSVHIESNFQTASGNGWEFADGAADAVFIDMFATQQRFDSEARPVAGKKSWIKTPLTRIPQQNKKLISIRQNEVLSKRFLVSPVMHPLAGTILSCIQEQQEIRVVEIDANCNFAEVRSIPLLSIDLRSIIDEKYQSTVKCINNVLNLVAGVYAINGKSGILVAGTLDVAVMESSDLLRVIAVWRWGLGFSDECSLAAIVLPPNGDDLYCDLSTLQVADCLLFMAGSTTNGACIFICKALEQDAWVTNQLPGRGNVCQMTVTFTTKRENPYLIVARADLTLSVWNYQSALKSDNVGNTWLSCEFTWDRLSLFSFDETLWPDEEDLGIYADIGFCTSFSWFPSDTLLLVAAGFENGIALFHIDRNLHDFCLQPPGTPILTTKWRGRNRHSTIAWMDLGISIGPLLVVLLQAESKSFSRFIVMAADFTWTQSAPLSAGRILCKSVNQVCSGLENLISIHGRPWCLRSHATGLTRISLELVENGIVKEFYNALAASITSGASGLTSSGHSVFVDDKKDDASILHILSTLENDHDRRCLVQRYWLCFTQTGSCDKDRKENAFGEIESSYGGSDTVILCDYCIESLSSLKPSHLLRCSGSSLCAVVFNDALMSDDACLLDSSMIAVADLSDSMPTIEVIKGVDLSFFSNQKDGLILRHEPLSLTYFMWCDAKFLELGKPCRPLLGFEADEDFIDTRRVFVFSDLSDTSLAVYGKRFCDHRNCLCIGDTCSTLEISASSWTALLPNVRTHSSFLFETGEDMVSVTTLGGGDERKLVCCTSRRIVILSLSLSILAQSDDVASCCSLTSLGSSTVGYLHDNKLRYLCCMDQRFSSGTILSLRERRGCCKYSLLAIQQDRILTFQNSLTHIKNSSAKKTFLLETALINPVLLLEPMIANALCQESPTKVASLIRTVVERFGRRATLSTHGDNEGISLYCFGVSPRSFELLERCGHWQASAWLLTGTLDFARSTGKILPPWMPAAPKVTAAPNADICLHVLSQGDEYITTYLKSSDVARSASLPRQSDPSSYLCFDYAKNGIRRNKRIHQLRVIDMVGSESADIDILQVGLINRSRHHSTHDFLNFLISNKDNISSDFHNTRSTTCLASVPVFTRPQTQDIPDQSIKRWMKPLAPSIASSVRSDRTRHFLLAPNLLELDNEIEGGTKDLMWKSPCNEAKHVWNGGSLKAKESLLLLDTIEEWLGRRRPKTKAAYSGEKTLFDLMNKGNESFTEVNIAQSVKDEWVEGIGEGRTDDANLVGYYRMSESNENGNKWKTDGLSDISPYQNTAVIVGNIDLYELVESTSNVDQGEPGKVKSLFDLVFSYCEPNTASGLAISATRGDSLDIGFLHDESCMSRKKCTIEFWFYLPSKDDVMHDIVLARRSFGMDGNDMEKILLASDNACSLWEVTLRKNGEIVLSTFAGSKVRSTFTLQSGPSRAGYIDEDEARCAIAGYQRWNHICLVFSSNGLKIGDCRVSIYLKGVQVASDEVCVFSPEKGKAINELMQQSQLVFGLSHCEGFRMTELRIWACERAQEDISSYLYEYLAAAELKKKFKVKISGKNNKGSFIGKGIGLVPPKSAPGSQKLSGLVPPRVVSNAAKSFGTVNEELESIADSGLSPLHNGFSFDDDKTRKPHENFFFQSTIEPFENSMPLTPSTPVLQEISLTSSTQPTSQVRFEFEFESNTPGIGIDSEQLDDIDVPNSLWETAVPLSMQIRPSAAAALIRGPPATRHFGGNRGGLPDFSGIDRVGVGGMAISGSDKTIVYRDNEDPPALTYPIGASGAIVSDQMNDEGNEFLCCFLAKERKLVVFELRSRTVVVELQMATKLNFWRYLPYEAASNTLCFMLVTPVGGFHWLPLEDSPRPQQVWKRGKELQGTKIVSYEEGGSNGLDGQAILSRVGLVMATRIDASLEAWIMPIAGDSKPILISDDVMGACLCQPLDVEDRPFLPLLVTVHNIDSVIHVNVVSIVEPNTGSIFLGDVIASQEIDTLEDEQNNFPPPSLAMGTLPEALCISCSNIIVVILRRQGIVAAFELEEQELDLIAQERVGHFVIDAIMRFSAEAAGAEIIMLLSDSENAKDGRIVSFCFHAVD